MGKKVAPFLENIHTVIFDMDGVITSERNYWNAAALTVYEMLNSRNYYGKENIKSDLSLEEIKEISHDVFSNDRLISLLKDKGINTNWDLAFVVLCSAMMIQTDTFYDIYEFWTQQHESGMEIYTFIEERLHQVTGRDRKYFSRHGELWKKCQMVFQEWYLGDEVYYKTYGIQPTQPGKKGLVYFEQPIVPLEELKEILRTLSSSGIRLGIGTGRPYPEIERPLADWDVKKYFDERAFITYTDVINAEEKLNQRGRTIKLVKPHPYVFLKAVYGKDYDDEKLLNKDYNPSVIEKALIVGDAGSDIMAAKAMNCKFAAVLTGVAGKKAKSYFEDMGADYILDSIREFIVDDDSYI